VRNRSDARGGTVGAGAVAVACALWSVEGLDDALATGDPSALGDVGLLDAHAESPRARPTAATSTMRIPPGYVVVSLAQVNDRQTTPVAPRRRHDDGYEW
jgi:hypothetical protein